MHTLTKLKDNFHNCQKCEKSPLGGQLFLWFKGPRKLTVCPGPKPRMYLVLSQLYPGQRPEMLRGTSFLFLSCFSFYVSIPMSRDAWKPGVTGHLIGP